MQHVKVPAVAQYNIDPPKELANELENPHNTILAIKDIPARIPQGKLLPFGLRTGRMGAGKG